MQKYTYVPKKQKKKNPPSTSLRRNTANIQNVTKVNHEMFLIGFFCPLDWSFGTKNIV